MMCLEHLILTELYCAEINVCGTINKLHCPTLALFRGNWLRLLHHSAQGNVVLSWPCA